MIYFYSNENVRFVSKWTNTEYISVIFDQKDPFNIYSRIWWTGTVLMVVMMLNTKTTNTGMAHTVDQEAQTVSRLTDTDHTVDILSKILSLSSMEKSLKIIKFQLISLEQPQNLQ